MTEQPKRPRKKRRPSTTVPMKNGVPLPSGVLKEVVIGTVVRLAAEEGGATPPRVYEVLCAEGYNVTRAGIGIWLSSLYSKGIIDRDRRGLYLGPGAGPE